MQLSVGGPKGALATGAAVVVVVVVVVVTVVVGIEKGHFTLSGYVELKVSDMQHEQVQVSAAASSGKPLYHLLENTAVPGCRKTS